MSEDPQVIIDASDLRKYRTELPNLYDDSDLTVYEFRLLAHYKRVGKCTEGLPTTSSKCKMSTGQASEARQSLADKGFVRLEKVPMGGARYAYHVHVIDRWIENFARYSGLSEHEIADQLKKGSPSRGEGSPSQSPSHSEGKKELKNLFLVVVNEDVKKIAAMYEEEFGAITALVADNIKDAVDTYPPDWIPEAMQIAVKGNKRSWAYVEGILKNCMLKKVRPSLNKSEANHGNGNSSNRSGAKQPKPARPNTPKVEQDAGKLDEINRRRRERKPQPAV